MNSEPPVSTSKQRTVLVTGATNGLGRALVGKFAQEGAHVLIHGRYAQRAEAVRDELAASTGNQDLDVVVADLADLHQVRQLAHDVPECCEKLDILINNAGISSGPPGGERQENPDGIEMRFAVNYLASYYLTRLLLPLLRESAPSHIVNIASAGQHPIDFDDPMLIRNYSGTRAYARSKLALIMFTFDLAKELEGTGVRVNAVHPATYMNTAMVREAGVTPLGTVDEGVQATLRLVNSPDTEGLTGCYFHGVREAKPLDQAHDPEAQAKLRTLSDELLEKVLS